MDVSALLAQYLAVKAQINYDQLEDTKWANLHRTMSAQLSKQTTAEGAWESSSDALYNDSTAGSSNGFSKAWKAGSVNIAQGAHISGEQLTKSAEAYASAKVPKYDPAKLEEYEQLDTDYDMMQTMYDSLLDQLNSQADSLKSTLGTAAKDTGTLDQ